MVPCEVCENKWSRTRFQTRVHWTELRTRLSESGNKTTRGGWFEDASAFQVVGDDLLFARLFAFALAGSISRTMCVCICVWYSCSGPVHGLGVSIPTRKDVRRDCRPLLTNPGRSSESKFLILFSRKFRHIGKK